MFLSRNIDEERLSAGGTVIGGDDNRPFLVATLGAVGCPHPVIFQGKRLRQWYIMGTSLMVPDLHIQAIEGGDRELLAVDPVVFFDRCRPPQLVPNGHIKFMGTVDLLEFVFRWFESIEPTAKGRYHQLISLSSFHLVEFSSLDGCGFRRLQ